MDVQPSLTIIKENFIGLVANNQHLAELFVAQGCYNYVVLLPGPVFTNLVKTFWVNASISDDHLSISANILGIPLIITEEVIAELIGFEPNPSAMDLEELDRWNTSNYLNREVTRIFNNAEFLTPFRQSLFRFVLTNLTPRGSFLHLVSCKDRFLIHRLENSSPLNLPAIIFCHLRDSLIAFACGQSAHIPYGRILSALLEYANIIQTIRDAQSPENDNLWISEDCVAFYV